MQPVSLIGYSEEGTVSCCPIFQRRRPREAVPLAGELAGPECLTSAPTVPFCCTVLLGEEKGVFSVRSRLSDPVTLEAGMWVFHFVGEGPVA